VDGPAAWTHAGEAGASPADLAIAMGNHSTHELVYQQLCTTIAATTKGLSGGNLYFPLRSPPFHAGHLSDFLLFFLSDYYCGP
jgi:hypothetical protein